MKILFSTFGSLGDLHPYIAIALEAQKRGHEPAFATAPKYRAKLEALGLEFRPMRPDLPSEKDFAPLAKRVMDLKDGPRYLFQDILSPSLRDSYADLLAAADDIDLLISHPAVLAGPLVGEKTGKKWLSSVLAPISLWSALDPPVPPTMPQFDFLRALGPVWPKLMFGLGKSGTKAWVAEVEKLRGEIGLPAGAHPMFDGQFSPLGTLALFSKHFVAPQPDWPINATATGFCFYDASGYGKQPKPAEPPQELSWQEWVDSGESPLDWPSRTRQDGTIYYEHPTPPAPKNPDWKTWMQQGDAPLVFALGSSAVFGAGQFWKESRALAQLFKQRAIFLTGGQAPFRIEELGQDMLEVDYAPFSELFPLAKVIVHQGGAGTTAQALRAGVSQLIVPHAHDQPDNAGRIKRLGLGRWVSLKKYLDGGGAGVLEKLFADLHVVEDRARQVGEAIRAENGPLAACEAMERVKA